MWGPSPDSPSPRRALRWIKWRSRARCVKQGYRRRSVDAEIYVDPDVATGSEVDDRDVETGSDVDDRDVATGSDVDVFVDVFVFVFVDVDVDVFVDVDCM
jgi:hypothetical protein